MQIDSIRMTQYSKIHLTLPISQNEHKPDITDSAFVIFSQEIRFDAVHTTGLMGCLLKVLLGFSKNRRGDKNQF